MQFKKASKLPLMQQMQHMQQMQVSGMAGPAGMGMMGSGGGNVAGGPIPLEAFSQPSPLMSRDTSLGSGSSSTYKQHKDTHAFDFVQDMMKKN